MLGKISVGAFVVLVTTLSYFGYQSLKKVPNTDRQPTEAERIAHQQFVDHIDDIGWRTRPLDGVDGIPLCRVEFADKETACRTMFLHMGKKHHDPHLLIHAIKPLRAIISYGIVHTDTVELGASLTMPIVFTNRGRTYGVTGRGFNSPRVSVLVESM